MHCTVIFYLYLKIITTNKGAVVYLKSGSDPMTIEEVSTNSNHVKCIWHHNHIARHEWYDREVLTETNPRKSIRERTTVGVYRSPLSNNNRRF